MESTVVQLQLPPYMTHREMQGTVVLGNAPRRILGRSVGDSATMLALHQIRTCPPVRRVDGA